MPRCCVCVIFFIWFYNINLNIRRNIIPLLLLILKPLPQKNNTSQDIYEVKLLRTADCQKYKSNLKLKRIALCWNIIMNYTVYYVFFPRIKTKKRYVKFMQIKFSLFQSRSENIIHDCLNLLKKEKKYLIKLSLFIMKYTDNDTIFTIYLMWNTCTFVFLKTQKVICQ